MPVFVMLLGMPPDRIHFGRSGVVMTKPTCRNWQPCFCLNCTGKATGEDNHE